jgi:tetratricopeptide (TPR) repeat protein
VIANYVFGGISQDAFACAEGRLHEWRVSLLSPDQVVALDDPTLLRRLVDEYDLRPAPAEYYGEADLDAVLAGYARSGLEGRTVYFPCAAIRCIRRLADLTTSSTLLLSADRGQIHEDAVGEPGPPQRAVHGSFSLAVDYHAIAEYVRRRGGQVLQTSRRAPHLTIASFVLGERAAQHAETRLAFEQAIDRAGPDDLFSLRRGLEERHAQLGLESLVALIRLSHGDPQLVSECIPALRSLLGAASASTKRELARAVASAWENHYAIGEERDPTLEFARLLYDLDDAAAALELFRAWGRLRGDDAETHWNIGVCLFALGRHEEASRCFAAAASLEPGFRPAPSNRAR